MMPTNAQLPETLTAGQSLRSRTGLLVAVVCTSHRTEYGEPIYRLRGTMGVVGSRRWTRDELCEEGVTSAT